MRKSIWITCVVVLTVCLLLLFKATQRQKTVSPIQSETPTNQPSQSEPPKAVENRQTSNTSGTATIPPAVIARPATPRDSNAIVAQKLAAWQGSIEFYGKVVDENSNAVAGATASFHWVETPTPEGNRTATNESDAEGSFSLHGQRGLSLSVSVSKEGYYASRRDNDTFVYGSLQGTKFSPDPQNPVIFNLRKKGKGESLVESDFPGFAHIAQLHHDGTPVELDLYKGAQVPAGNGQLKLEFWRAITNQNANIFDWKCELAVPGGGLVETPEEFAFAAPDAGYQPSIVIDMLATNENWQGEIRSKYYLQLPDGKYGRIDFYLLPRNGVFTVQSAINPTGSRNLEPAN